MSLGDEVLLVLVEKPWFSKSPWDSYTKRFLSEEELLDWWLSLPDDSFTKKHANIGVYRIERVDDILAVNLYAPPEV